MHTSDSSTIPLRPGVLWPFTALPTIQGQHIWVPGLIGKYLNDQGNIVDHGMCEKWIAQQRICPTLPSLEEPCSLQGEGLSTCYWDGLENSTTKAYYDGNDCACVIGFEKLIWQGKNISLPPVQHCVCSSHSFPHLLFHKARD